MLDFTDLAARLILEEGLDYGAAKQRAVKQLGLPRGTRLPSNEEVESEVRERIALFHADTQPGELQVLRQLAAQWMDRLQMFRPHLCGAVWRGTANRLSVINLDLYVDDPKAVEIELINQGLPFEVATRAGSQPGRSVDVLCLEVPCKSWGERVPLRLHVLDFDDLRGALKPDAQGQTWRGDLAALRRLTSVAPEVNPPVGDHTDSNA